MYRTTGSGQNWALVVPSLDLLLTFNGRTPKTQATSIEINSLAKLFAAVTERYVACDGTVVNETPPPSNDPPSADFGYGCAGLGCDFTDGSTDSDGTVVAWEWSFGDGEISDLASPSHVYAGPGAYTVSLGVTDDGGTTTSTSRQVTVSLPPGNSAPAAGFTSSCVLLVCTFTDTSTDTDGSVSGWSWIFGDGATSTARNPSRTYAAAGTYGVTLTVTDDDGASHQRAASVTVTAPAAITLTATKREDATKQYMILRWTGARSTLVDIWRNGVKVVSKTPNDGRQTISRKFTQAATYQIKVCEAGTTTCSNTVKLVFN